MNLFNLEVAIINLYYFPGGNAKLSPINISKAYFQKLSFTPHLEVEAPGMGEQRWKKAKLSKGRLRWRRRYLKFRVVFGDRGNDLWGKFRRNHFLIRDEDTEASSSRAAAWWTKCWWLMPALMCSLHIQTSQSKTADVRVDAASLRRTLFKCRQHGRRISRLSGGDAATPFIRVDLFTQSKCCV